VLAVNTVNKKNSKEIGSLMGKCMIKIVGDVWPKANILFGPFEFCNQPFAQ
jgi:hypothetical protein